MIKQLFSPQSLWPETGLSFIRILLGLFISYHGLEVFQREKMVEYAQWMSKLEFSSPVFMAYLGKGVEFFGGIFFLIGLFTRVVCIPLVLTMTFITFFIGHGKIFTDDQHPFLYVLLFLVYFFTGPGKYSIDRILFGTRK